jgi:membrane protein implicated in regulation of membrane protease activity
VTRSRKSTDTVRYWLLQVPGWGVLIAALLLSHRYAGLSYGWALVVFGVWLLKDWALYPVLKKHYRLRNEEPAEAMLGRRATAEQPLHPRGYVRLHGELWLADAADGAPIERGEEVVIEGVDGLTLRVRRSESGSERRD